MFDSFLETAFDTAGSGAERPHSSGALAGAGPLFKPGDLLGGRYEIVERLGMGGFGVVYKVYSRAEGCILALKTLRDEGLVNPEAREAFRREALLWVGLGEHPCILTARRVELFSGRPFVAADVVAPEYKGGPVSLQHYLEAARGDLDPGQALRWAIQFCLGMEHANRHGIRCHLDVKPANMLIMPGERMLKITDFGLARAWAEGCGKGNSATGTPGYLAPEVFRGAAGDVRSDVFSFALVLWQLAAGDPDAPYAGEAGKVCGGDPGIFQETVHRLLEARGAPPVEGPLREVIRRGLAFDPADRYADFAEMRAALDPLLVARTGRTVELESHPARGVDGLINQGRSLCLLGRHEEALVLFDRALALAPASADAWNNRGSALRALGRPAEAGDAFKRALAEDPRHSQAWSNLGCALHDQQRYDRAMEAFDQAVKADPRNPYAWSQRGVTELARGRPAEAATCFRRVLEIDRRDVTACGNLALCHLLEGRAGEALRCCEEALKADPACAPAYRLAALALAQESRFEEGAACAAQAVERDPGLAPAWTVHAHCLRRLGRFEDALQSARRAVEAAPRDAGAYFEWGAVLADLAALKEAVAAYETAVALQPRYADAWFKLAETRQALGDVRAAAAWRRFIELAEGEPARRVPVETARAMLKAVK